MLTALMLLLTACPNAPTYKAPGARADTASPDSGGSVDSRTTEPVDADGDGYDATIDCDDQRASVHPGADETCDGHDQDCDAIVDEEPTNAPSWYSDLDGDGYGGASLVTTACEGPDGTAPNNVDCDDNDASRNPGEPELCDDADQDCDEFIDEEPYDGDTWYVDQDGDGYGDPDSELRFCEMPAERIATGDDCDDTTADISPDALELCSDGVDNDCSGLTDCDDAACAAELHCYESSCDDGEDQDLDSYIDCDDDDCWGVIGCGPALYVTRGRMVLEGTTWQSERGPDRRQTWDARLYDLGGVLVETTTSGGVASCAWSLDAVTSARRISSSYAPLRSSYTFGRSGLETDCERLSLESFPFPLRFERGRILQERGGLWYHGAATASTVTTSPNAWGTYSRGRWSVEALSTSDPWSLR